MAVLQVLNTVLYQGTSICLMVWEVLNIIHTKTKQILCLTMVQSITFIPIFCPPSRGRRMVEGIPLKNLQLIDTTTKP